MKSKFVLPGIAFLAMIVAAPTVSVLYAQGNGIVALANGSGQTTSGGQLRTFTFTAARDSANVSSGQAELFNRASGVRVHIDINCLNVVGTTATMSGTVSTSNQTGVPFLTGDPVWFTVVDNGHGTNSPPDLISYVYFFSGPPGIPCTNQFTVATVPVENGNVTVH